MASPAPAVSATGLVGTAISPGFDSLRWCRPLHGWTVRHRAHPLGELGAATRKIIKVAIARSVESDREDEVQHPRWPKQQLIADKAFKNIGHALAARHLMGQYGGGTLIGGASHFAGPHGN